MSKIDKLPVYFNNINLGYGHIFAAIHTINRIAVQEAEVVVKGHDYTITAPRSGKVLPGYFPKKYSDTGEANYLVPRIDFVSHSGSLDTMTDDNRRMLIRKHHGTKGFKIELKTIPVIDHVLSEQSKQHHFISVNDHTSFDTDTMGQIGHNAVLFTQIYGDRMKDKEKLIWQRFCKIMIHAVNSYKIYGDVPLGARGFTDFFCKDL